MRINSRRQTGARPVTNAWGFKFVAKIPGPKTGCMVISEGSLESDFISVVLANPELADIQYQPVEIRYLYLPHGTATDVELLSDNRDPILPSLGDYPGVRRGVYYPDFLVTWKNGVRELVEVKHSRLEMDSRVQRKKAAGEAYARARGWQFNLYTDKHIRQEPRLTNAKVLLRYRQQAVPEIVGKVILDKLRQRGRMTIGDLALELDTLRWPHRLPVIYAMLARGQVHFDPGCLLNETAEVFI